MNDFEQNNINAPIEPMADDTQMSAEASENKRGRAMGIAAAVIGSVAAGGGAAYALNRFLQSKPAPTPPGDEQDGDNQAHNEPTPQDVNVHNRVIVEHKSPAPKPAPEPPVDNNGVEILGTEEYVLPDGETVTVGYMRVDGKLAMVVDTDNDGIFDVVCYDENGDGDLQANEVMELPTGGNSAMYVVPFMQAAGEDPAEWIANHKDYEYPIDPEEPVQLVGMAEVLDAEGNPMTMAGVTVDGEEVVLVDVDHDGQFDLYAYDKNGDGEIQDDEVHIIEGDISVDDVASLPQNPNYDDNVLASNTAAEVDSAKEADSASIVKEDERVIPAGDQARNDITEDEPIAEEPADDSLAYEEPDQIPEDLTTEDNFGTMGDEGINC